MDVTFGPYRLKRQERRIEGSEGPVELSARAFDILCLLLDRPGEVLGKEAIFAAVWPGVVVEENTLQVHISALRKALDPNMIVTVHGRGYKYGGPPPQQLSGTPSPRESERKPVIVVLPFDNASGDPEQQYFSDGITQDITDRLTRFRLFSMIGQHTAAAFRAAAPDYLAIRNTLRADYVVTGSVRRAGDRVRITTRLTEAVNGESVWAERYDRPLTDLFILQDEISELIAAATARQLEVEINVRSTVKPPASLSSYELLLQGYWHFKRTIWRERTMARQYFARAAELDPRNAEAVSWLGATYCDAWVQDFSVANAVKGRELVEHAVSLDPSSAICHAFWAWALLCNNDRVGAVRAGGRGAALNPGDPAVLATYALALSYDGNLDEARANFDQARRLEPVPPFWFGEFEAVAAFAEGRYADCLDGVEPVTDAAWDIMYSLACYGHLGLQEKARGVLARMARMGADFDFDTGAAHEPFRDPEVSSRLREGLARALAWRDR